MAIIEFQVTGQVEHRGEVVTYYDAIDILTADEGEGYAGDVVGDYFGPVNGKWHASRDYGPKGKFTRFSNDLDNELEAQAYAAGN